MTLMFGIPTRSCGFPQIYHRSDYQPARWLIASKQASTIYWRYTLKVYSLSSLSMSHPCHFSVVGSKVGEGKGNQYNRLAP